MHDVFFLVRVPGGLGGNCEISVGINKCFDFIIRTTVCKSIMVPSRYLYPTAIEIIQKAVMVISKSSLVRSHFPRGAI